MHTTVQILSEVQVCVRPELWHGCVHWAEVTTMVTADFQTLHGIHWNLVETCIETTAIVTENQAQLNIVNFRKFIGTIAIRAVPDIILMDPFTPRTTLISKTPHSPDTFDNTKV